MADPVCQAAISEIQQRRVLLRPDDVAIPHAAAGLQAVDGEFDGIAGVVLDEVGDPLRGMP
jgi:hypothetical protein